MYVGICTVYVYMYVCAFRSSTQCDLHLFLWLPWQQEETTESLCFLLGVFLPHVVSMYLYVFGHTLQASLSVLIQASWFPGRWKVAINCVCVCV